MSDKYDSASLFVVLTSLKINTIDNDFVRKCWENNLDDSPLTSDLQEELNELDSCQSLIELQKYFYQIENERDVEDFWACLKDNGVNPTKIVLVLSLFISRGLKRAATSEYVRYGLIASSIYFRFISLQGSKSYNIFNFSMLKKSLDYSKLFEAPKAIVSNETKKKKKIINAAKGGAKKKVRLEESNLSIRDDDSASEDELQSQKQFEIKDLMEFYIAYIKDFSKLILYDDLDNVLLEQSLNILFNLLDQDTTRPNTTLSFTRDMKHVTYLPHVAFRVFSEICCKSAKLNRQKIPLKILYRMVFYGALTNFNNINASVMMVNKNVNSFVMHIINKERETFEPLAKNFIFHSCVNVPDKTEHRSVISEGIISLMKQLQKEAYIKIVEWITTQFVHSLTASNRMIALDLIFLLLNEEVMHLAYSDIDQIDLKTKWFKALLHRCSDTTPNVCTHAINLLSDCFKNNTPLNNNWVPVALDQLVTPEFNPTAGDRMANRKTIHHPCLTPHILDNVVNRKYLPTDSTKTSEDGDVNSGLNEPIVIDSLTYGSSDIKENSVNGIEKTVKNPDNSHDMTDKDLINTRDKTDNVPINTLDNIDDNDPVNSVNSDVIINVNENSGNNVNDNGYRTNAFDSTSYENRLFSKVSSRSNSNNTSISYLSLLDNSGFISMLRRRCNDSKVFVRKAAVIAITNILLFNPSIINKDILKELEESCIDIAISVRKQAMQSLTDLLLKMPSNQLLHNSWLRGILIKSADEDSMVVKKMVELFEAVLLKNILPHSNKKSIKVISTNVWKILELIVNDPDSELIFYFRDICKHADKSSLLPKNLMSVLQSNIDTENDRVSWFLISEFSLYFKNFNIDFLVNSWPIISRRLSISLEDSDKNLIPLLHMLQLFKNTSHIMDATFASICSDFLKDILLLPKCNKENPIFIIGTIMKLASDHPTLTEETDKFFRKVIDDSESYFSKFHQNDNSSQATIDGEEVIRRMRIFGDVLQYYPKSISKKSAMLILQFISDSSTIKLSQVSNWNDPNLIIPSQLVNVKVPVDIRSNAFVTLGKLCMTSLEMAKLFVPSFAKEIECSQEAMIRNNIMVVLCDMMIKFPLVVDPYTSYISVCLKDASAVVRKQALILLTRLLQEDYIKWKGSLFYRYVSCIVDPYENIRDFAKFTLNHVHQRRMESLYFHHFVESIFYYNGYTAHPKYNKFDEMPEQAFILKGHSKFETRKSIYEFLLSNIADSFKFQVMSKLVKEVLLSFVEEIVPLDNRSSSVLKDALICLASKEIKLKLLKNKEMSEEFPTEQKELENVAVNVAKKIFVDKIMKKTVMETNIPILISLKHLLEKHKSPLLKELMEYFVILMKDYRTEVQLVLACDSQLLKELEYDMSKLDSNNNVNDGVISSENDLAGEDQKNPVHRLDLNRLNLNFNEGKVMNDVEVGSLPTAPLRVNTSTKKQLSTIDQTRDSTTAQSGRAHLNNSIGIVTSSHSTSSNQIVFEGNPSKNQKISLETSPLNQQAAISPEKGNSKKKRMNLLRAISTPSGKNSMSDVTFEDNLSIITGPVNQTK